jgi:predicted RNase H-like HicB family nuclease
MDMSNQYTAAIKQDGDWWIGWVEEVPGVNCQEASKEALIKSLSDILKEALDFNRADAIRAAGDGFEELIIAPEASRPDSLS